MLEAGKLGSWEAERLNCGYSLFGIPIFLLLNIYNR
jgi:hypothetical protein